MALTNSEVAKLYVAMFNRAPDAAGLAYWVNSGLTIEGICASFFDQPETVALYPTTITDTEFVTEIYSNLFNRAPDAAGLTYWVDQLTTGAVSRAVMVLAVVNGAQDTAAGNDATTLTNKTTAGLHYAVDLGLSTPPFSVSSVDATSASLQSAITAIDALDGPDKPTDVDGATLVMTEGRDNFTVSATGTTTANDTIYGFVGQNQNGSISNAFSTGDFIDGGTGTDTLYASIMNDNEVDSGATFDINGRTKNVEIAKFEVLDEGVVVDAGAMDSVSQFWSVNSDDTGLVLEDVRLGTKLSITKDITFEMQDVDYGSDLTVGFDSNSFKAVGNSTFNSQIVIEVGDSNQPATATTPLENIEVGLKFTYDGTVYTLEGIQSTDGTYVGLMTAISAVLADEGLTNLIVQFGADLSEIEALNDTAPLLYSGAKQIIITDPSGVAFEDFQSEIGSTFGGSSSSHPISNTYAKDPSSASGLIESNLVLDNAGRGSTAGTVQIGAMSNSLAGIQQFNVFVEDSSAIAELTTTHNKLQNVYITSRDTDTTSAESYGDLEIGDINGYNDTTNSSKTTSNGNNYLSLIDASAFKGANLQLGATNENGNDLGIIDEDVDTNVQERIDNVKTLNANIAANVTFNAETIQTNLTDTDTYMNYTTGTGNDKINVLIDGDSVDSEGEGMTINANSGDNVVTVKMTEGVTQATMATLDNLDIATTSGVDKVTNIGIANFDISVGDSSDMVYINSIDASAVTPASAVYTLDLTGAALTAIGDDLLLNGDIVYSATAGGENAAAIQAGIDGDTVIVDGVSYVVDATVLTAVTLTAVTAANDALVVGDAMTATVSAGTAPTDATADQTVAGVAGTATTGEWAVSGSDEGVNGSTTEWVDRVLYHATLTINFAGFEQTVEIATTAAKNFVATQMDINNAIKAAIAANPELARLLTTTDTTIDEQLVITSNVEGANDLTIDVFQPTAIHTGTAAVREVLVAASDTSALRLGLIQTLDMHTADSTIPAGVADDSEDVETAEEIAYIINAKAGDAAGVDSAAVVSGQSGDGHLDATGAALAATVGSTNDTTAYNFLLAADGVDGTDETLTVNYSSIDMGNGANDLVVLNSNAASANTLVFSNTWGKVSVVNFFMNQDTDNNGEDGIANIAVITPDEDIELSDAIVGLHELDFTKWLDDKIDSSINTGGGSLDSAIRVATTLDEDAAATLDIAAGNEVLLVNDFEKGDTNNTETWAGLTATVLQNILNGTAQGTAATGWGNLMLNSTHTMVADIADNLIDGITDVVVSDTAKIDSVFMIENDDNQGEYKVFNVEWSNVDGTTAGSIENAVVSLIGVIDFGESITVANGLTAADNFV